MDLWQFTPLHEAASKSRIEVCSLLLSHGADPTLLNCHSKSAMDVAPTRELQVYSNTTNQGFGSVYLKKKNLVLLQSFDKMSFD